MQPTRSISSCMLLLVSLLASACGGSSNALVNGSSDSGSPSTVADTGSGNAGDAGGGQTCSAAIACGTGGTTYEECTTLGASGQCLAIVYKASDGHAFTCDGCTSCADTQEQLAAFCRPRAHRGASTRPWPP